MELEQEIRALLEAGNKIGAIKVYRERTSSSLAQAKEAVESLEEGGSLPSPGSADSGDPFARGNF